MKKRWICLFVENEIGVLAKISALFSGKLYNLNSLTVGATEDSTISRMTISLTSDDRTFEQVKKQLNRFVEVIKVVDLTDLAVHLKELMFITIRNCPEKDMTEIFRITQIHGAAVIDYCPSGVQIECVQSEDQNNRLIALLEKFRGLRMEITRGGSVAVEALCCPPVSLS